MIRSIEIANFRGIENLRLNNLGRLNVLVGPNGSGKTAFLEAIYLAGGNSPETLLKTKQWRGREIGEIVGDMATVQNALWADTFRDASLGVGSVAIEDDQGTVRRVTIHKTESVQVVDAEGRATLANVGMKFRWDGPEGHAEVTPEFTPSGIQMRSVFAGPGVFFMPARMNASEAETARLFSRLMVEGDPAPFRAAFEREFNWLTEVDVQAPSGPPALFARMKKNGRKLPLTMLSGGVSHLAALMVRLAASRRTVVLIDEIENGFYYDRYESIWRTLFDLAKASDSQIFTSTHSLECLTALSKALAPEANDIRFIRTRLSDRGEPSFQKMTGDGLFKALQIGEVR